jgi:hypothetical protein
MEIEWIETRNQKVIYELMAPRVRSPTVVEQVGIKICSQSDTIHMMLEMEYLYLLMPNLEAYYLFYQLPMNFKPGVALQMLGTHITNKQFLAMWKIEDLESREYLAYTIIHGYIWYNELKGYGALEFIVGCLGLHALKYYYKLEIEYCNYYHHHQIARNGSPTFAMTPINEALDHVVN